jgi:hypothetical protein
MLDGYIPLGKGRTVALAAFPMLGHVYPPMAAPAQQQHQDHYRQRFFQNSLHGIYNLFLVSSFVYRLFIFTLINKSQMLILSLTILTILLLLFRILRGESIMDIHREIKELKAQDVPHYFWKSVKIVFSFKGPFYKRKQKKEQEKEE